MDTIFPDIGAARAAGIPEADLPLLVAVPGEGFFMPSNEPDHLDAFWSLHVYNDMLEQTQIDGYFRTLKAAVRAAVRVGGGRATRRAGLIEVGPDVWLHRDHFEPDGD